MDWSKTKTIFILIFLVLDLFLAFQLMEKKATSQLEYITETTIEEQLDIEDITYVELPEETEEGSYITGISKNFDAAEIENLQQQSVSFLTDEWIISTFHTPIALPEEDLEQFLQQFIQDYVISGDSYVYWDWNKKINKILFFQTYKGKPLYFNENAMLSIQLNENNEIISYEQTMLSNIKEIKEEGSNRNIIPALRALEYLYKQEYLTSGRHITKVELGYYKYNPNPGNVQIFVPTWHIVDHEDSNYFVNAMDGQVIEVLQSGVGEEDEYSF